jgi:excisionase family DNA binding protein
MVDGTRRGDRMNDKTLLRAEEVARLLGIGRSKTYELIARGELPSLRIGRLVRVPRHALDRWIADHTEWREAG